MNIVRAPQADAPAKVREAVSYLLASSGASEDDKHLANQAIEWPELVTLDNGVTREYSTMLRPEQIWSTIPLPMHVALDNSGDGQ